LVLQLHFWACLMTYRYSSVVSMVVVVSSLEFLTWVPRKNKPNSSLPEWDLFTFLQAWHLQAAKRMRCPYPYQASSQKNQVLSQVPRDHDLIFQGGSMDQLGRYYDDTF
jgi:hypothetical protein